MSEVKVGDRIYLERFNRLTVETVTKITPTMIRSKNYNYDKPRDGSGWLHIKGQRSPWETVAARLETPELRQRWWEQTLREWMKNNYQNIPLEDIIMLQANMQARKSKQ